MARSYRLTIECLEDRIAPATYGIAWPEPGQLTLSFVPDGTSVAGSPSVLFKTLTAQELAQNPTLTAQQAQQQWQSAILRAFQTWGVNTNINIGLVPDDGEPLGAAGPPQGDAHFGDIRISMVPLAANQTNGDLVAFTQPYSPLAGTWAGDVELNAAYFGGRSGYDIFSVLLHEAGHVYGFPDTTNDPSSVMYRNYIGVRAGLSAVDITNLQGMYGIRQPDGYEPNGSQVTATQITPGSAAHLDSQTGLLVMDGDLTTTGEADYYQYQVTGKAAGNFTITLHTSGVSLLVPQLAVYDTDGTLSESVQSTTANLTLPSDLTISVPNAKPGDTYYIKIQGATNDVYRIGSYELELAAGKTSNGPNNNSSSGSNNGKGSGPTVTPLQPRNYTTDGRFDYAVQGAISAQSPQDQYSFFSPAAGSVMIVTAWGAQPGGLQPWLRLEDSHGNPLPVQVLVNQDGTYTFQLPNALANTKYLLAVQAEDPNGTHSSGNYFLGIDFGTVPIVLTPLVNNQVLDAANPWQAGTLPILETQLIHLVFTAVGGTGQLTVYDSQGKVLGSLTANAGQTVTANLVLNPGLYTVRFTRAPGVTEPVTYTLQYQEVSDAIGPEAIDTTLDPGPTTPTGLPSWWQFGYSSFLGLLGGTSGSLAGGTSPGNSPAAGGSGAALGKPMTGSSPSAPSANNAGPASGGAASNNLAGVPLGSPSGPSAPASGAGAAVSVAGTTTNPGLATVLSTTNGVSPAMGSGGSDGPFNASGTVAALQWLVQINRGPRFLRTLAPSQATIPPEAVPADSVFDARENDALPSSKVLPLKPYADERGQWFAQPVSGTEATSAPNLTWLYVCFLLGFGVYPLVRGAATVKSLSEKPPSPLYSGERGRG